MAGFLQDSLSNIRGLMGNLGSQVRATPDYISQYLSRIPSTLTDFIGSSQTGGNVETPPLSPAPTPTPVQPPVQIQPQTMAQYQTPVARNPQVPIEQVPTDLSLLINQAAQQYGIPPQLLFDIAFSESGLNPQAQNPASTAAGLFQFTQPTWQDVLRMAQTPNSGLNIPQQSTPMDPQSAALAAAYLISQGQLGRWQASQGGWGQYYSPQELAPYLGR